MAKSITVTTEGAKSYEICLRHDFSELAGMLRELGYQRDQSLIRLSEGLHCHGFQCEPPLCG